MSRLVVAKQKAKDRQIKSYTFFYILSIKVILSRPYIFSSLYLLVGHTVNSQWLLERVENVNIKYYIKHSSPWQWYGYYFNSANFLTNFIYRSLSMFKDDKYITNSLIITKYINKTYQHKNNVYLWQLGFQKGDNLNTNRTHPLYNLPERVQILGYVHIICITVVNN
jgi:hypothetical protein